MHNAQLDALDRLIGQYPDNAWFHMRKGEALDQVKDSARAAVAYEQAVQLIRNKMSGRMGLRKKEAEEKAVTALVRALYDSGKYAEIEPFAKFPDPPAQEGGFVVSPRTGIRIPAGEVSRFSPEGEALLRKYLTAALIRERNGKELTAISPIDVSGLNFDNADFSGLVLDHANFAKGTLRGTKFGNASLREADFRGADLRGVEFKEADLTGAKYDCTTELSNSNPTNGKQMVGPVSCR